MKLKVKKSLLCGTVKVPGSKSHTIRAIAAGLLAPGESVIENPLDSLDTISCLRACAAMGGQVEVNRGFWKIIGTGGKLHEPLRDINMGNSGTGTRIFTGIAATGTHLYKFDGDKSLRCRPMGQLFDALTALGAKCKSTNGKCPFTIQGPIKGGETRVDGKSSQFLTSLLFATPLAENDTKIEVYNLQEKPYVKITLDWLDRQQIKYQCSDDLTQFYIPGRQRYHSFSFNVPADFSTATFPLVAAAVTGSEVNLENLDFSDRQGDKAVFDYLTEMGMEITTKGRFTNVRPGGPLRGIKVDLNATPDALPAMAVAGACASGKTYLTNVPQARIKETDRIACMTAELRKMGVEVEELEDGMIITGCETLRGAEVEGHDDHRIVMALALAGMAAEGTTIINGGEAAAVTFPNFFRDFENLGAVMQQVE